MLIVLTVVLIPDSMLIKSPEYDEIKSIQDWRMSVGPGYFFLIATIVGFVGILIGGLSRLFGMRWSRHVIVVAAIGTIIGYPGYETYTYTYLTAAMVAVWTFLIGWLVATPVPVVDPKHKGMARKTAISTLLAVIAVFSLYAWFVIGSEESASFAADVSVDIEVGGQTVVGEDEFRLTVGRFSTIRPDGYVVDMIIQQASLEEAVIELQVFENANGRRGRKLTSCVDFHAPIGQVFGVGVSCGNLLIGLSGQLDPVD